MASDKKTFEADTFEADTFASGVWRGASVYAPPTEWLRVDCGTLFTAGAVVGQVFAAGARCGSISHGA